MPQSTFLRTATFLALVAAFISGTNNFLTKIAVTAIKNPIVFTTLKNAIVAVFLIGIVISLKKHKEILSLKRGALVKLAVVGAVGGFVPFALYFTGLAQTSALNASLIHKTLFIWVMILAMPLLKERMTPLQSLGIGAIFVANIFVGGFEGFKYNAGELMILAATILWAVENVIAKAALRDISSSTVAASRMTIGSVLLLGVVVWQGNTGMFFSLSATQWGWTLLTTALLAGFVLLWYSALKRAPATYVATLLVPATLITNILSAVFITHAFNWQFVIQSMLFIVGTVIVVYSANNSWKMMSRPQSLTA